MTSEEQDRVKTVEEVERDHLEEHAALGRVTAAFAQLEFMVGVMITWYFEGKEVQALTAIDRMSLRALLDTLGALTSQAFPNEDLDSFMALLKRAEKLSVHRNDYVHSFWMATHEGTVKVSSSVKRKSGYTTQENPVSVPEMTELARETKKLGRKLLLAMRNLHGLPMEGES